MNEPALDPVLERLADQVLAEIEAGEPASGGDRVLRSLREAASRATSAVVATPPPRDLMARLRSDALRHLAEQAPPKPRAAQPLPVRRAPWLLPFCLGAAAAASLLLALRPTQPAPQAAPAPEVAYAALAADPACNVVLPFKAGPSPLASAVGGEVVWSDARQQGFLRFRGLPRLDPATQQFQLWIFDSDRSAEQPVDGGLFEAGPDGEALVPVDAKIHVHHAHAFALTIEPRGGVVVSRREHLVAIAGL